jgi:2-oxoglutarate dehydrogenase E2 component (dihydrolipoamide succinyltransferase)
MSFFVKAAIDALKQFPGQRRIRGNGHRLQELLRHRHGGQHGAGPGRAGGAARRAAELRRDRGRIADLATRARDRKIAVEELQGGTFTITNGGIFGSLMSTPIINPPQSAILGLHAIQERPVAATGRS